VKRRLDDVVDVETGLVARSKPASRWAEAPLAVIGLHHVARQCKGSGQAQHRRLVHARAAAELGQ
jgi:hypothetical protein